MSALVLTMREYLTDMDKSTILILKLSDSFSELSDGMRIIKWRQPLSCEIQYPSWLYGLHVPPEIARGV